MSTPSGRVVFAVTNGHDLLPCPLPVAVQAAIGVFVDDKGETGFDQNHLARAELHALVGGRVLWRWHAQSATVLPGSDADETARQVRQNASPFALVVEQASADSLDAVARTAVKIRVAATTKRLGGKPAVVPVPSALEAVLLEKCPWSASAVAEVLRTSALLLL